MRQLLLFLLLLWSCLPATAAEQPTVWERIEAGEFVVFATIIGADNDQIAAGGIEPFAYLDGGFFREGPDGEPVDLEYLKQRCLEFDPPNNVVAIDLEDERVKGLTSWSTDESQWEAHARLAEDVVAAIREVRSEWKFGWFGRLPHFEARHLNGFHANPEKGPRGSRYREWQNAVRLNRYHKSIAGLMDFFHPCLYMTYWEWEYSYGRSTLWYFSDGPVDKPTWISPIREAQHTPLDVWNDVTSVGLRLTRRTYPKKPIIPAISPQWWIGGYQPGDQRPERGEYVCSRWTRRQLDLLKVHADSVVIWSNPEDPEAFIQSSRWRTICQWAADQRGE